MTGATGGIGGAIAEALVKRGVGRLLLACRSVGKAQELKQSLLAKYPGSGTEISVKWLDLASTASVKAFAGEVVASGIPVHALVNNAGIMPSRLVVTDEGHESATAVNYVATVLLTESLLPAMAQGGVVVMTTSVTRRIVRLRDDWAEHARAYHGPLRRFLTYGRSKLMLARYARELARRLEERKIRVNCADPGIVNSKILKMDNPVVDRLADWFFRPFISSPRKGAKAALAAMDSSLSGRVFYSSGRSSRR